MDRDRDAWIDYAKAIGIILVVYGHVARGIFTAGLDMDPRIYEITDNIIYSFHMPLFFFLSGLFLLPSLAKRSHTNLLFNKVDTILYPYVIWSLLQGSIEIILSRYTNGHVTFSEVFSLAWQPRAHFWFLYVLFFFFLFSSLIYRRFSTQIWCFGVFCVTILLYFFSHILPNFYIFNMLNQFFVYFSGGVLVAFMLTKSKLGSTTLLLIIGTLFVISQWLFQADQMLYHYSSQPEVILLLAFIGIMVVVIFSKWLTNFTLPWLAYLGRQSMTIYLVHILAGSGCRIVLQKFFHVTNVPIHLLVGTLGGLILPLLFFWLSSKAGLKILFSPPKILRLGGKHTGLG